MFVDLLDKSSGPFFGRRVMSCYDEFSCYVVARPASVCSVVVLAVFPYVSIFIHGPVTFPFYYYHARPPCCFHFWLSGGSLSGFGIKCRGVKYDNHPSLSHSVRQISPREADFSVFVKPALLLFFSFVDFIKFMFRVFLVQGFLRGGSFLRSRLGGLFELYFPGCLVGTALYSVC